MNWRSETRPRVAAQRGFTLLEVLVAFAIVAIALPVIVRGTVSAVESARTAQRYGEALSRARSHLAAIADTGRLAARSEQGDDGGGFRWDVRVTPVATGGAAFAPVEDAAADGTRPDAPTTRVTLFAIVVSERWGHATDERSVHLMTERMQAVGPQREAGP